MGGFFCYITGAVAVFSNGFSLSIIQEREELFFARVFS